MADDHIKLDDDAAKTGPKLQTVKNTIGADDVHAEAMVPMETDGTTLTDGSNNLQVKVNAALPAGTNNVGEVDVIVNTVKDGSGSDLHPLSDADGHLQIDVLSGGGGGTQYQEDSGHSSGHTGTVALVVRKDTATQLADTDTDYTVLITDANGRLHTKESATATEGSALGDGVLVQGDDGTDRTNMLVDTDGHIQVDVLSGGIAGTEYTEADIDASITGPAMIAEGTSDTLKAVRVDDDGALHVSDGGNTLTVDGTVSANSTLQTGDNVAGRFKITDGTEVADVDASNHLEVVVGAELPAGTQAIGKLAANTGVDIGDVDVTSISAGSNIIGKTYLTDGTEDASVNASNQLETAEANSGSIKTAVELIDDAVYAEDAGHSDTDKGIQVLGVRNDTPTARSGANADYTPISVDRYGRTMTSPLATYTNLKCSPINCSTSGNNTIVAAQGANTHIVVWGWFIVSDGTVDFRWEDGADGGGAQNQFSGQVPLQAREGVSYPAGNMPYCVVSANTLLNLELSAAINVHGSVSYTVETI